MASSSCLKNQADLAKKLDAYLEREPNPENAEQVLSMPAIQNAESHI